MATKTITSEVNPTKVGSNGTTIYTSTRVTYTLDQNGKVDPKSVKQEILYRDAPLGSLSVAAVRNGTSGNWTINNKPLSNTPWLGADAQKSLKEGALKTTTNQQIDTASKKEGLTPEQVKTISNTPNKSSGITSDQISATAGKEVGTTRNEFPGARGSDPLRYPINLKSDYQDVIKFKMVKYTPKKFSETTFGFGSRNLAGSKDRQIIGTVILPIPTGISDTNAVSWSGQDMNALDAAGANLALSGIEGGGDKMAATAENIVKTISGASADVQKGLASAFAGQATGVQGILTRTTGLIINPNMELLFQAPTLRPFTFTFKLSARSDVEAKTIRSIIRFFKQGMSPIRTQSQLFLKSPHTFQLEYLHKNKPHSYLNKFKECALQSFSVSYTPEGQYATFTDGAMVSYQVTMQFQELEPVFNDDYGNASNAPDIEIGY